MEKPRGSVFCYVSGQLYSLLNTGGMNQDREETGVKYGVKKARRKNVDLQKKKNLVHKLNRLCPMFMMNSLHV